MVSDYKFVEQEDHEQGFAAIFDSDIAPLLQELEEKRIKAVRKSQIWVALIMTVSAGLAFQASTKIDPLLGIFPIAFGGAGALIVYFERTSKLRSALTDYIRPLMCDFLKLAYQRDTHFRIYVFVQIGPSRDRSSNQQKQPWPCD